MVLVGKINKEIVAQLQVAGVRAVGLSGDDGGLIRATKAERPDVDLGFVGDVEEIDSRVIQDLHEFVPVVASVGVDATGQSYNINADVVAGALAASLRARRALFLTDVPGLMRDLADPASLVTRCTLADLAAMAADGVGRRRDAPKAPGDPGCDSPWRGVGEHHRRACPTRRARRALHRSGMRHAGRRDVSLEELVVRERAAVMQTYRRAPVAFARGEGAHLYDLDGRRYVDCLAGIGQSNVGHCHPAVVAAIQAQAATLINTSNLYYTEPMIALAEWLQGRSLGGRVFFCNSGAEASEAAMKLARKRAGDGRPEIVALVDGFHGRTYGALSLTGQPGKQTAFAPLVPGVIHITRNDIGALERAVGARTGAIVLEPIQGEIGVHPLEPAFVRRARELADAHGATLIFDEIQTGMGRTGPLFAYQDLGVEPDVMCLAKSLGGGVPIGAVVTTPALADVLEPGDHGSTFAGGPLACAAALAACEVLDDPGLRAHVREVGGRLLDGLRVLVRDGLAVEARGRGLMCGVDLAGPVAPDAVDAMLARGYLINATTPITLRFLPPLVIDAADVDELVTELGEVARELLRR